MLTIRSILLVLVGFQGFAAASGVAPVIKDGSEYRVENVQADPKAPLEGWVKAFDVKTSAALWQIQLYSGTAQPAWAGGVKNPKIVSLASVAQGLVVKTDDGATFFVDLAKRQAELVRDLRRLNATCDVHHRAMTGELVPIHYGLSRQTLGAGGGRVIEGGCCVMPEKQAIVDVCPQCSKGKGHSEVS